MKGSINSLKSHFKDPRDHLSVEQIEGQISKFAREKKNAPMLANGANDLNYNIN